MQLVTHVLVGVLAGLVGTLAMDLVWFSRYRRGGGTDGFYKWDSAHGTTSYDSASAPAQVWRIVRTRLTGSKPPDSSARAMTNLVHWLTGAGWGAFHGVLVWWLTTNPLYGLATGLIAFLASYAILAPLGVYQALWKYEAKTIYLDLSGHLVFGLATGVTAWLLLL